jgi:hypothetical protein
MITYAVFFFRTCPLSFCSPYWGKLQIFIQTNENHVIRHRATYRNLNTINFRSYEIMCIEFISKLATNNPPNSRK